MPSLLHALGLGAHAKPSCFPPLREDHSASWGIFDKNGSHFFKYLGNNDSGDEVTLIARLKNWDTERDFVKIIAFYQEVANQPKREVLSQSPPTTTPPTLPPDVGKFHPGTEAQLKRLSELRAFSPAALQLATERGFLLFGQQFNLEVFGVRDRSGRLAEVRRLDDREFPPLHSLRRVRAIPSVVPQKLAAGGVGSRNRVSDRAGGRVAGFPCRF